MSGSMQGAGGFLAVTNANSTTSYPTYDGNGNVSEYMEAGNTIVAHYEYDAFGNEIASKTTGSKADDFAYKFSTKYQDSETDYYYYGYRYYDPVTGRWPSRDPIGERGGANIYVFVENNSMNYIDILGLEVGGGDYRNILNALAAILFAVTGDSLGADMLLHYGNATGDIYKLNYKQVKKLTFSPKLSIYNYSVISKAMRTCLKDCKDVDFETQSELYGVTSAYGNNALGQFNIEVSGGIKFIKKNVCKYEGSIQFKDTYNFGFDWLPDRSLGGNLKTMIATLIFAGKPFDVESGEYKASQNYDEDVIKW